METDKLRKRKILDEMKEKCLEKEKHLEMFRKRNI